MSFGIVDWIQEQVAVVEFVVFDGFCGSRMFADWLNRRLFGGMIRGGYAWKIALHPRDVDVGTNVLPH
jgi:hypothetical protein